MNHLRWMLFFFAFSAGTLCSAYDAIPNYPDNAAYRILAQPSRFSHSLLLGINPFGEGAKSVGYRLSYSLGMPAVDLGVQYVSAHWGSLVPHPSYHDEGSAPTLADGSLRNASDPWSLLIYEIGYSIRGRLYPFQDKDWIQYARVSLAYSQAKDKLNSIQVKPGLFGVETGLTYLFDPQFGMTPNLTYRFGMAEHIPFSLFQLGMSVSYFPK